jgi:hypothetical protein
MTALTTEPLSARHLGILHSRWGASSVKRFPKESLSTTQPNPLAFPPENLVARAARSLEAVPVQDRDLAVTTIGYGDVYPVTPLGKCFAALIALLGVGTIALPAAILGSAFKSQVEEPASPARRFSVASAGRNSLGLRQACAEYVNSLWIPDHLTDDEAAASAMDQFRRAVLAELEMLEVKR